MAAHAAFDLDIVSALASQLEAAFERLEVGKLAVAEIDSIPPEVQGVYLLYYRDVLVYVGKADDSLRRRLHDHRRKIDGRKNIALDELGFKALYVSKNWTALAPEASMIQHYRARGLASWNGKGFGIHDPGRQRDTTKKRAEGFDTMYPIKDDYPCDWIDAGEYSAYDLLASLKQGLPYLLRYQTHGTQAKTREMYAARVTVARKGTPARDLLVLIARALDGFQATVFPSHMILYKERRNYTAASGVVVWPV